MARRHGAFAIAKNERFVPALVRLRLPFAPSPLRGSTSSAPAPSRRRDPHQLAAGQDEQAATDTFLFSSAAASTTGSLAVRSSSWRDATRAGPGPHARAAASGRPTWPPPGRRRHGRGPGEQRGQERDRGRQQQGRATSPGGPTRVRSSARLVPRLMSRSAAAIPGRPAADKDEPGAGPPVNPPAPAPVGSRYAGPIRKRADRLADRGRWRDPARGSSPARTPDVDVARRRRPAAAPGETRA